MKNILNEISSYEKEQILKKHRGGMMVETKKFQKLIHNKLGSVKPLLIEQEDPSVKYLTDNGYKIVDKVSLPNGQYIYGGSGGVCYIYDKDGKTNTGYAVVMPYVIRGQWENTPIEVIDGKFYDTVSKKDPEFKQILFKEAGYKPTQQTQDQTQDQTQNQTQTLTNKISSEGIKNVSDDMINSDPFTGDYSGYVFGGTFKGVNYQWDANGVEGMSGVRGLVDGYIISEKNSTLSKYGVEDADTSGVWVGFHDGKMMAFACYKSTSGTPKCKSLT